MDTHNGSTVALEGSSVGLVPASSGRRLTTYAIDLTVAFTLTALVFGVVGLPDAATRRGDPNVFQNTMMALLFLYYVVFEGLLGRTVGKFVAGTRVVSTTDEPLTYGKATLRALSRLVPFEAFSLKKGLMWHDRWTKTMVVSTR